MSLSVGSQAQYINSLYNFTNSSTYQNNSIDSSSVSSKKYNVSNITNALDSLEKTDSTSFNSIGNLNSYAVNSYKLSQLSSYDTLSNSSDSDITNFLSGESGANDIYSIMETNNSILTSTVESLYGVYTSSGSEYSDYLSETGNIIDLLA